MTLLLAVGNGRAQNSQPSEYQIKAAFLFNFVKFTEWPPKAFADATAPIVIGILGDNPFGDDLKQTIGDKTLNNRPLVIKEFRSLTEAVNCQVLFVSSSEQNRLTEILKSLQGSSVLTVGEMDHFTETGGMINFVTREKKIRFQINNTEASKAGLKISSKLLSLAAPTG
ncbi:MAG: YfiR family protein [Verrucomicrobia bacterium]|nr:YfiR family protein [Verrucomicrobiota bacterium]